ncbi:Tripartite tricarboxylate transporter TctA family protein [Paracoccus sediminis]|uniref:Tripartite tricarboxylate transporter TctA family protein n=1 Tax=Paracoccus sediminis TaxID=1214787 RepID=A0A238XSS0_9RHOB|nr:Tripartite tricarboxylate transporter TctA family protein [Paracoccus sediminis]
MLLVLNLPLVGLWVQILKIPMLYLYAGILVFATIGTYGISRSVFDLALLYGIGVLGFFMRRSDFPTSPVVIGMILGPFAEQQFRRAMTISQGDLSVFISRPISAALLLLALLAIMLPALMHLRRQRRQYPVDAD